MEEVIIDGCNVAECIFLDEYNHCDICNSLIKTIKGRSMCMTVEDIECRYYPDCYFKQLQRLKAELQRYKDME